MYKICGTSTVLLTSHHQSLASLIRAKKILTRIVSSEWSAACVTSLHSLRASPALPPQHNTFIIDTHCLRDTFNTTSFLHGSDWSPPHVLPPRKRLVSDSSPSSTEATGFRLMSFLHGSDWSRTTSCATAKTRFSSRTASFLSVFCTQIDR